MAGGLNFFIFLVLKRCLQIMLRRSGKNHSDPRFRGTYVLANTKFLYAIDNSSCTSSGCDFTDDIWAEIPFVP